MVHKRLDISGRIASKTTPCLHRPASLFQCGQIADAEAWEECHEEYMFKISGDSEDTPLYPYFSLENSVWPRIAGYVNLTMRYPRDILDGILGVLTRYERTSNMRHIAGVSVYQWTSDPIIWPQEIAHALSWGCDQAGQRRTGFPTWSWTGWTCKGFERNDGFERNGILKRMAPDKVREWVISLEHMDESTDHCDPVALLDGGHDLSQARFLRVSAPSLEAEIIPMEEIPQEQRYWTEQWGYDEEGFDNNEGSLGVRYTGVKDVSFINLIDSNWVQSPFNWGKNQCFAIIVDKSRLDIPSDQLQDYRCLLHATALLVIRKEDGWFEKGGTSGIDRQTLRQIGSVIRTFRLR